MGRSRKRKKRKPASQQARGSSRADAAATANMKGHIWLWFGGAMAALAALGGLQTVIELARWADIVVRFWGSVTTQAWSYVALLFGINFNPAIAPHLNFLIGLMAIGFSAMALEVSTSPPHRDHFTISMIFERFARSMSISVLSLVLYVALQDALVFGLSPLAVWTDLPFFLKLTVAFSIAGFGLLLPSQGATMTGHALLLAAFVAVFYVILTLPFTLDQISRGQAAAESHRDFIMRFTFGLLPLQVVTGLNFASPRYFNYRFVLILLTVAAVLALSYVSRLLSHLAVT